MRDRAELIEMLQSSEQLLAYALFGTGAAVAAAGLIILFFLVPAKTIVVTNGKARAEQDLRGSIISNGVYTTGVKLDSHKAEDLLEFRTRSGAVFKVSVRRSLSSDPASLIWYAPANPTYFMTQSPLRCFGIAAMCTAIAIWLRW